MPGNAPRQSMQRIRLPAGESRRLVTGYIRSRILDQVPPVLFMVLYLALFQLAVLGIPLQGALPVAAGVGLVILGLAVFIEGLSLGLMPLGETIGLRLPKKAGWPVVLLFAFLLGVLATLAEPAVSALKVAGASVRPWESPVLYALLNRHSWILVGSIGLGVGLGVVFSVIRYYRAWSLKVVVLVVLPLCLGMSTLAALDPKLAALVSLAWDSGGITTGPVTVPLALALGLGISRVVAKNESPLSGFGIVTMASLVPVVTVLAGAMLLAPGLPGPMSPADFAAPANRAAVGELFDSPAALEACLASLAAPGPADPAPRASATFQAPAPEQPVLPGLQLVRAAWNLFQASAQAVLPLCALLLLVLVLLRQRLARPDEVFLGIALALGGMFFLNAGLQTGLTPLGNAVGQGLPSTIRAIELPDSGRTIPDFDPGLVYRSVDEAGHSTSFFYLRAPEGLRTVPWEPERYDPAGHSYRLTSQRGPLFGSADQPWGMVVLLAFAFFMGFGATMAEPALITMGKTVEDITVGTFGKKQLMQAVAVGVGLGVGLGIVRLLVGLPLLWFLVPPYAVVVILTLLSDETFVNIAWDSAGVTTGPVTVPLVLAMGLGLGGQLGLSDGFGILALASVWPILTVLATGLVIKSHQDRLLAALDQRSDP